MKTFIICTLALALLSCEKKDTQKQMPEGLIAWYPFDGNANDFGPNKLNGSIQNAILTIDRHQKPNSAFLVNRDNGYITIRDFGNILPTDEITLSLWAKAPVSASNYALLLGPMDSSPDCFGVSINSSHDGINTIFWDFGFMQQAGDAPGRLYFRPSPLDTAWHQYVFVSSVSQKVMKIYRDNDLLCTKFQPMPLNNAVGKDLNIGKYFTGYLDDIQFYNRALTQEEIYLLFNE